MFAQILYFSVISFADSTGLHLNLEGRRIDTWCIPKIKQKIPFAMFTLNLETPRLHVAPQYIYSPCVGLIEGYRIQRYVHLIMRFIIIIISIYTNNTGRGLAKVALGGFVSPRNLARSDRGDAFS
jgi:hypothetical protein